MVKRKKHDKDKYYNLAKQQGYRARSAFKLIQLNKKYDFLSTAKVCIDLCAAPGGWCQVAAKYMPASSIILGIDLLPIRPIRGVKTFQCDITTQRCRQIIKQEMQSWQADVVLCDGAPNVGAEYTKDAYVQNELALVALKLAVDVMGRGGTFISKVFRSQDYNALLWVFKQLFKKVSATKPLSSRNESAEIFVVCEEYLAPHTIDSKLFDPAHVFAQVDSQEKGITIFHPKFGDRKRHREGMFQCDALSVYALYGSACMLYRLHSLESLATRIQPHWSLALLVAKSKIKQFSRLHMAAVGVASILRVTAVPISCRLGFGWIEIYDILLLCGCM